MYGYEGYDDFGGYNTGPTPRVHKTTRKDIMLYLQRESGCMDIQLVDDFESSVARHICRGVKGIKVLQKYVVNVPTSEGYLAVEYFICPSCRRLIVNKSCLEML